MAETRARDTADINTTVDALPTLTEASTVTNRNLLYNGAMQVAQRGTSVTGITGTGYNTADRYQTILGTMGTWTQTVDNDAPTGSGLSKSLKMLCTTADASPAAGDFHYITQILEGQDLQRVAKGTASAQQLTLSFWVKSNSTGTYIARLYDEGNNRSVSASYAVSASATWEKKSITFPADATGTFANNNAAALYVQFWLGAGSNRTSGTLQTTWGTVADANAAVGQVNLAAATNNYWQVTGVQLEVGAAPTAFEFKSFGQELRECQRYYFRVNGSAAGDVTFTNASYWNSTTARGVMHFPVSMRVPPTMSCTNSTNAFRLGANNGDDDFDTINNMFNPTPTSALLNVSAGISGTIGHGGYITISQSATSFVAFAAEL